jgi:hypothetical protein
MARWRNEALKRFPGIKERIEAARNVMALWIELRLAFENAYKRSPRDEDLIANIYDFGKFCTQSPRSSDAGDDPCTAAAVCFYEHIPDFEPARQDMPRWLTVGEVEGMKDLFVYSLGEDGYRKLLAWMLRNRPKVRDSGSKGV